MQAQRLITCFVDIDWVRGSASLLMARQQMAAKTLRELFVEELRDMYDGEKQLTRAHNDGKGVRLLCIA